GTRGVGSWPRPTVAPQAAANRIKTPHEWRRNRTPDDGATRTLRDVRRTGEKTGRPVDCTRKAHACRPTLPGLTGPAARRNRYDRTIQNVPVDRPNRRLRRALPFPGPA